MTETWAVPQSSDSEGQASDFLQQLQDDAQDEVVFSNLHAFLCFCMQDLPFLPTQVKTFISPASRARTRNSAPVGLQSGRGFMALLLDAQGCLRQTSGISMHSPCPAWQFKQRGTGRCIG